MAEEKKPGFWGKLWTSLKGGRELDYKEAMELGGIDLIKTKTLEGRLEHQQKFNTYIKETVSPTPAEKLKMQTEESKLNFYRERTININEMLMTDAIPWGTGGELVWYNRVSFAWSVIYSMTLAIIDSVEYLISNEGGMKIEQTRIGVEAKREDEGNNR